MPAEQGEGVLPRSFLREALTRDALSNRRQQLVPGRLRLFGSRTGQSFQVQHIGGDFTLTASLYLSKGPTGEWRTLLFKVRVMFFIYIQLYVIVFTLFKCI